MNHPITIYPQELSEMLTVAETTAWFEAEVDEKVLPYGNTKVQGKYIPEQRELSLVNEASRTILRVIDDGTLQEHRNTVARAIFKQYEPAAGGPQPPSELEKRMDSNRLDLIMLRMLFNQLTNRTLAA